MPKKVIVEHKSGRKRRRSARHCSSASPIPIAATEGAGYGSMAHYGIAANMAYLKTVKEALRHQPGAYKHFIKILSEVGDPNADLLSIIDRVVPLLDGHSDLIYSFNAFLPRNYEIELQDHAVVVKVYDLLGDASPERGGRHCSPSPQIGSQGHKNYGESVGYITAVKTALIHSQHKYHHFMEILGAYHSHAEDAVTTVRGVVRLLQDYPRLVLAFNAFLPAGCAIQALPNGSYTIQHLNSKGKNVTIRLSTQH